MKSYNTLIWTPNLLLVSHAGNASASIWPTVVPTWVGAIATFGLLIGAIITAYYARRALMTQSQQLADQRRINAEQTSVLELQTRELRESFQQREREAKERRRAQASLVFTWAERETQYVMGVDPFEKVTAHARNTSLQPIYDVCFRWHTDNRESSCSHSRPAAHAWRAGGCLRKRSPRC